MKHPAKFSSVLLPVIAGYLQGYRKVLDPMAGVGTLAHYLYENGWEEGMAMSNEIEREWMEQCPFPRFDYDARFFPWADGHFDAIATSPTYGNRMADHHEAKDGSERNTYRHKLGRPLSLGNTGSMQWGETYRQAHKQIISECARLLRPGGRLVWNVKDHIRGGQIQSVAGWHLGALTEAGLSFIEAKEVTCPGNRQGQNSESRIGYEWVMVFDKPLDAPVAG